MPATVQAQSYAGNSAQPAPLYPYELQPGQSYAMDVAPGTNVIHRRVIARRHASELRRFDRPHGRYIPAPIVEMRQPAGTRRVGKPILTGTRQIVHEAPVVIVHRRLVEHPPRVIVRRHFVEGAPRVEAVPPRHALLTPGVKRRGVRTASGDEKRVIHAEAEITILGSDRINIRLYRKRGHSGAQVFDKK